MRSPRRGSTPRRGGYADAYPLVSRHLPNLGCAKRFLPAGVAARRWSSGGADAFASIHLQHFEFTPESFTMAASTSRA
jgi:hypothetical protein